jgi:choline dehydrogenase
VTHHISGTDRYAAKEHRLDTFPGFAVGVFQLRTDSRGSLRFRSTSPQETPVIEPHYLIAENDRIAMPDALRLSCIVAKQPGMADLVARETRPGIHVKDDDGLLDYIRTSGQANWRSIGACKIGMD